MSEELKEVKYYELMSYKDSKAAIKANVNQMTANFVVIGYYLKHIREKEMYLEDGYQSIWELAQNEFGFSQSWASRCMSINDRFSKDGNSPIILEQYRDFDKSKLSEMLTLTDKQLEQVTITTTVAEIKDMKRSEKSYATSHKEPEPEKVAPEQLEQGPTKTEPKQIFPKICKYDSKSNCVAMCTTGAECCAECEDHGSCNVECGWQDERIPKQEAKSEKRFTPLDCVKYIYEEVMSAEQVSLANTRNKEELETLMKAELSGLVLNENEKPYIKFDSGTVGLIDCKWYFGWPQFIDYLISALQKKEIIKKNISVQKQKHPKTVNENLEIVDTVPEIESDVYESVIETANSVIEKPEDDVEEVETVEAEIIETLSTETKSPDTLIPSHLVLAKEMLKQKQERLREFINVQTDTYADRKYIESRKVEVGALAAYIFELEGMPEPINKVQPELPILKNNDQRAEWLRNYKSWGEWYQDDNINARYYKYDFPDGSRVVVVEYLCKRYRAKKEDPDSEWGSGHYHLIHSSDESTYYCNYTYNPYDSSLTEIVEHLKKVVPRK